MEQTEVRRPTGPKGLKSILDNSTLSQGALELQFRLIGIGEIVVPQMCLKWMSLSFTSDCCNKLARKRRSEKRKKYGSDTLSDV